MDVYFRNVERFVDSAFRKMILAVCFLRSKSVPNEKVSEKRGYRNNKTNVTVLIMQKD